VSVHQHPVHHRVKVTWDPTGEVADLHIKTDDYLEFVLRMPTTFLDLMREDIQSALVEKPRPVVEKCRPIIR
jgi:hypothetical protein